MKNLFILLALIAFPCISSAQAADSFIYSKVIEVPAASQAQLYQRAMEWVNSNFRSGKSAIQSTDKEQGVITGKGNLRLSVSSAYDIVYFTFTIAAKDGRYKYVLKDFFHEGTSDGGPRNAGGLTRETPLCGRGRMTMRYWMKVKVQTDESATRLLSSLEQAMATKSAAEGF